MKSWQIFPALMLMAAMASSPARAETTAVPDVLSAPALESAPSATRLLKPAEAARYREIFTAIREQRWAEASTLLATSEEGPLHLLAQAELYLAKGSPKVELEPLLALLARAPELPQAEQLARLARTRGATALPSLPEARRLIWMGAAPRRERLDSAAARTGAAALLQPQVMQLLKTDLAGDAEALVEGAALTLDPAALAEFRYLVAWSWYTLGNDPMARAVAARATGGSGRWAIQAQWVVGLAAWRQQDFQAASMAFAALARGTDDRDMRAAANYWSARADLACGRPQQVQMRMRSAAAEAESFYGMLAAQYLGLAPRSESLPLKSPGIDGTVMRLPNLRAAVALADIGENDLADRLLRQQARIGSPADHGRLIALAAQLNLPATQYWLAHNAPDGARPALAARYPIPGWKPANGWRVDKSLLLAHGLQESSFRPGVVSSAGAQGVMQVMPGTAALIARRRGEIVDPQALKTPSINIEFGQSYLEELRDQGASGGLLPKVIAAYNAGPGAVARWNSQVADKGDPLLYIESIPYWETRGYVMSVLRNFWMYQRLDNKPAPSLAAMAQGMWPRFPGMPGKTALRIVSSIKSFARAD